MAIIIRLLVIALIIYLSYRFVSYLFDARRKFNAAVKSKTYHFYDDIQNVRKNFFMTLRGVIFEGEKYLNSSGDNLEVVSIFVWTEETDKLKAFTTEDFHRLEKEIQVNYPNAAIHWKIPIDHLSDSKTRIY